MDENRGMVRAHVETGVLLSPFLTGGVAVELERTREGRWRDFFRVVGRRSDLTYDQIMARLEEDETLRDMVVKALTRTTTESDSEYRDVIAEIVGSAFDEGTSIEETDHLLREVQKLEPVHLRVMRALFRPRRGTLEEFNRGNRHLMDENDVESFQDAELLVARPVELKWIIDRVDVSLPLIDAALLVLIGAGYAREVPQDFNERVSGAMGLGGAHHPDQWVSTQWAGQVMGVLYPHVVVEVTPPARR